VLVVSEKLEVTMITKTVELTHSQWVTLLTILDEAMTENARTGYKENNPFLQRIKTKLIEAKTS
jgi:hypothetical protein